MIAGFMILLAKLAALVVRGAFLTVGAVLVLKWWGLV